MTNEWNACAFRVVTDQGDEQIAGWSNGLFALDFRVFDVGNLHSDYEELRHGWAMTHLPTGRVMAGLVVPLIEAQTLAERIAALGDWNFSDADGARRFSDQMRALRTELNGKLLLKSAAFGPLFFANDEVKA